jgi:putative addiction module component (TIGR02574 family)
VREIRQPMIDAPRKTGLRSAHVTISDSVTIMSKPVPLPPPGFDDLSVDDQIAYVQSLWDRIAATPDRVPVPEWHREVLDERLKDYEQNSDAGTSWDVIRKRVRRKLRQL